VCHRPDDTPSKRCCTPPRRSRREKYGNYVPTVLGERYDAFCWFDRSQAVRPLHLAAVDVLEPETYPSGV
jgi:erythromycin esterase